MAKRLSKSKQSAIKTIYETFKILKEAGGEMRGREVIDKIRDTIEFTEWEKERYEKTGYIRWESLLHFYTIDFMKAGYMQKEKGIWILTPEGEEAFNKMEPLQLLESAQEAYRKWQAENEPETSKPDIEIEEDDSAQKQKALLQQYEEKATEGILEYVSSKNPYEFQDLVAALLRAMGYYISFNAKRGKDGGIDIVAYSDPLGTKDPRMKVQVKHRPNDAVAVDVIRQLVGLLNKPGDVGLFVTSGRFTSESERYSRETHKHVELIDFERFVSLWQQFYGKLNDEEKNMLPLQPIYFLGVNE